MPGKTAETALPGASDEAPARGGGSALLRQAAPMVVSRAGLAAMAVTHAVMLAQDRPHELAAWTLSEGTFGRLADMMAAFLLTGIVLVARARPALGAGGTEDARLAARRIALWQRAAAVSLLLGLAAWAASFAAEPVLVAAGQDPALAGRAGGLIRITAAGLPAGLLAIATAVHLEAVGCAVRVALWLLAANLVNFGLDWGLIGGRFGLAPLGAEGAAWATLVVRVGLACGLVASLAAAEGKALFRFGTGLREGAAEQGRLGLAAAGTSATMHILGVWLTLFAGWLGALPLAAFSAGWMINLPALLLAAGVADAIAIRVASGAREPRRAGPGLGRDLGTLALALLPFTFVLGAFPDAMARLYTPDAGLRGLMQGLLPLSGLVLLLDGLSLGIGSALRGRKDVAVPAAIQIATMAATPLLGAGFAFGLDQGVTGLLQAIALTSAVRLGLLAVRLRRSQR